jgi:NAD-dependent SIR2 family protein deacetylase
MTISGTITVFITGAGLSAASGIPTFRHSEDAVWSGDVWTSATREVFRRNPLSWWNNFWLQSFPLAFQGYSANAGHEAIAEICNNAKGQVKVLTQNVDGLHQSTVEKWNWEENLVEAHGRLGLYKCIPTEKEEEEEDKLGDDEKLKEKASERKIRRANWCKNSHLESLCETDIVPKEVRDMMVTGPSESAATGTKTEAEDEADHTVAGEGSTEYSKLAKPSTKKNKKIEKEEFDEVEAPELPSAPLCSNCSSPLLPQALMFDESYSSHEFYEFDKFASWFTKADVFVFVGTSFAVTVTDMAIKEARKRRIPVFNFNLESGRLEPSNTLNVENVIGKSEETLVELSECLRDMVGGGSGGNSGGGGMK